MSETTKEAAQLPVSSNAGQSRLTVRLDSVYAQKALSILLSLAQIAASGRSMTIEKDFGFGSATLIDPDGNHTHFGSDNCENDQRCFESFVDGLHGLLVEKRRLSWVKPSNMGIKAGGAQANDKEPNI